MRFVTSKLKLMSGLKFVSGLKWCVLTALLLISPLISPVSAINISASRDAAMTGALRLVSLGLETAVPANATLYYNFFSIGILFLIAALSSSRNTRFFAVLIPVFAALFVYFEWLKGPDPIQMWGVIVMCIILGVAIYMKESLRERFGVGGPGSMIVNLMIFMILLQTTVGVLNMTNIWEGNYASTPQNEWTYDNVNLEKEVPLMTNSGGLVGSIASTLGVLTDMMISALKMFLTFLVSLGAFAFVLNAIYPWICTNADGSKNGIGVAILGLIQVGIWLLYMKFIFDMFYKPPMGVDDF